VWRSSAATCSLTANFNNPASFTYTVIDGTVDDPVNRRSTGQRQPGNPDAASTPINTLLASIVVLANDTDVDGNPWQ
jgi:hypothetical protein